MYSPTNPQPQAQIDAMERLEKQGYRFANWIKSNENMDTCGEKETFAAIMVKRVNRYTREMREVETDGSIN